MLLSEPKVGAVTHARKADKSANPGNFNNKRYEVKRIINRDGKKADKMYLVR